MKRTLLAAAACLYLAVPALAAPGDMNVATFLAKADTLKAKGAMAMFSPELKVLKAEGEAAGDAYRARLKAERAAGRPSSCPPANAAINSDELLAHMRSYPAAARPRISIKQAMADYFTRKYPCR